MPGGVAPLSGDGSLGPALGGTGSAPPSLDRLWEWAQVHLSCRHPSQEGSLLSLLIKIIIEPPLWKYGDNRSKSSQLAKLYG